ncbi:P-loop containing nucleoside triphosphate hydrolase protein [Catenaria anguillulae PL171]|uniref:p-loop containing nucleoside triphosphate hydrolase protein n=1 Tax=Catenaria anguillulae PL171 TaxID=765915 RepID=A0A1Y2I333_9FUNG|nr:P-loop containing nucleoside triphosphate hydrolase protein [Catenaria anguillulae PL171]
MTNDITAASPAPGAAAEVAPQQEPLMVADRKQSHSSHASSSGNNIPTLPEESRIGVAFSNVIYSITTGSGKKATTKRILKDVSCSFKPGRFTVILGASGAGKTSLLNAIAGETKIGSITGNLYLNGQAATGADVKKVSGYVTQEDIVLGTMSVREAITMSARLRLPRMSEQDREIKVQEIMGMLGLTKCMNTIIGTATEKGISGGERKRVLMAMDLVTDPSVTFLDEPTSGLDSFTAFSVVQLLRDLARSGRTVIATLHQPSSEIFHMIDDLCIMSQGEIMYYGPAEESVDYFASKGYPCPRYSNPADYFFLDILNTTSVGSSSGPYLPEERIPKLLDAWKASPNNAAVMKEIQHPSRMDGITADSHKYMSSFSDQFPLLMQRALKNALRNKLIVKAKLGQTIFLGVLMGLIYLNVPSRTLSAQIQDRSGVLFFVAVNQVMSASMGVLSVFAAEKAVFEREHGAGYYQLPAYFISKVGVELPFQIVMPLLLVSIVYFMVGLQADVWKFFITVAFSIVMSLCGTAIGTLAACAFNDLSVALAIVPVLLLPLMIFSGLFVNTGNIPAFLDWIKWLSPMKYGFVGLVKNEFTGLTLCPRSDEPERVRRIGCRAGETVISDLGLEDQGSILLNFLVVLGLWVTLLGLSYLSLWRIVRNSKKSDFPSPAKQQQIKAPEMTGVAVGRN